MTLPLRAHEAPPVAAWIEALVDAAEPGPRGALRRVDWVSGGRVARFERGSVRLRGDASEGLRGPVPLLEAALKVVGPPPAELFEEPPSRPIGPEVSPEALGDEAPLLTPILDRWAELVAPVRVHALDGGGHALRFPALPEDLDPGGRTRFQPLAGFLFDSPHRAVREALGFRSDPDRVLRTVPTPATLIARARAHGVPLAFVPRLVPLERDVVPPERWVRSIASGVVPIHVPGQGWSRLLDRAFAGPLRRVGSARSALASRLAALPHDLGKHVLVPRRVPPVWLRRAEEALPTGSRGDWTRWVDFFEDDLPIACERLFARCDEPTDFDALVGELPTLGW